MGVTDRGDGTIASREQGDPGGSTTEEHALFSETLETYIGQLERFAALSDAVGWKQSVIGLRHDAHGRGAQRIATTASLLLDADISDGSVVRELLDRLRSDGRIFALEELCRRKDEALASELAALNQVSERDRG